VRSLAAIMRNGDKDATRVQAAAILLDRGWGKALQPHGGDDGNGNIQVIIRQIIEINEENEPVLIEHEPDRRSR